MKYLKIIGLTIAFSLIFSMSAMAYNEVEIETTEDIAALLGKMKLISGDDEGYNLEGQLTRAEASTFIVKILGKEATVLADKVMYIKSNFPDINGDEWYAPFVGFCERGYILTGFPDGTVQANTTLSEKAFLTMILKAMGYTSEDFSWDTVYSFAFEIGVITDEKYKDKIEDDLEYTRGDAVKVMYNALRLKKADDKTSFIDDLINNEVITKELLVDNKMIQIEDVKEEIVKEEKTADIATRIESVNIISEYELTVTLNESIDVTRDNIKIYRKDNQGSLLMVKGIYVDKNVITIKSIDSTVDETFVLEMYDLMDEAGYVVEELSKEFEGFKDQRSDSEMFFITSINRVSDTEVAVYFNQTLNSGAWISIFYAIYLDDELFVNGDGTDISVKFIDDTNTSILIKLNNHTFDKNKAYEFRTISGFSCNSGLKLETEKFHKFHF